MAFSDNYIALCAAAKEAPTALAEKLGYSRPTGTSWCNGATPRKPALRKIAEHFNVTVEELLAEKKKPAPTDGDGLEMKLSSLSPGLLEKLDRFLELAKADPETAERFLSFAVQELESSRQER